MRSAPRQRTCVETMLRGRTINLVAEEYSVFGISPTLGALADSTISDIRHPYVDPTPPTYFVDYLNQAYVQNALGVDLNCVYNIFSLPAFLSPPRLLACLLDHELLLTVYNHFKTRKMPTMMCTTPSSRPGTSYIRTSSKMLRCCLMPAFACLYIMVMP